MPARFDRLFPRAALVFSAAALVVTTAPVLVALSISVDPTDPTVTDLSALSAFVVNHFRIFALAVWGYFAIATISAVGLLRKRLWAYRAWLVLLGVGLAWGLAVALSETIHLFGGQRSTSDSVGFFPPDSILAVLVVVPTGLVMAALLLFLLRKLVYHRETLVGARGR